MISDIKCCTEVYQGSTERTPLSEPIRRSFVTFANAASVLWWTLKADWNKSFCIWSGSCFTNNCWNKRYKERVLQKGDNQNISIRTTEHILNGPGSFSKCYRWEGQKKARPDSTDVTGIYHCRTFNQQQPEISWLSGFLQLDLQIIFKCKLNTLLLLYFVLLSYVLSCIGIHFQE